MTATNEELYNLLIHTIALIGRTNAQNKTVIRALLPMMRATNALAEALEIVLNTPREEQACLEDQIARIVADA